MALLAAIAATLATGVFFARKKDATERLAAAAAELPHRVTAGRLAPPFDAYAPRMTTRGRDAVTAPEHLALHVAAARILSETAADAGSRRVSGIARLLAGDPAEAIADLETASQRHVSADTHNDLAVAYLARAESDGAFAYNVDALFCADLALELDPDHAGARFNRALALERLGLLSDARIAWRHALDGEPRSQWSSEAAQAERRLDSGTKLLWRADLLTQALAEKDDVALRALLRQFPREVRSWGDSVFPAQWAEALAQQKADDAARALDAATRIGQILLRDHRERLLADSVAVITKASAPAKRMLARAYLRYRDGRLAHSKRSPSAAEVAFRESRDLFARAGSPMVFVATYYLGSALHEQGRITDALAVLDGLADENLASRGYHALDAQIGWERGLELAATGALSKAIATFERSRRKFGDLRDSDSRSRIEQLLAETIEEAGDLDRAWLIRRDVLQELSRRESHERMIVALSAAADLSIRSRQWRRAVAILNVAVANAAAADSPELMTQALLQRALAQVSAGNPRASVRNLEDAARWSSRITDAAHRERITIDELFVRGMLASRTAPAEAEERFAAAASLLEERGAIRPLAWIYLERARAARRLGRNDHARAFLAQTLRILEDKRRSLHDYGYRALILSSTREAFEEAISLELEQGRQADAFDLAERARARALLDMFERRNAAEEEEARPRTSAEIVQALAPNAAIIAYTALEDRLLIQLLRSNGLTTIVHPVTRSMIAKIAGDCSSGFEQAAVMCRAAHDALLAPVASGLGNDVHVAVVPDPVFASLPVQTLEAMHPLGGRIASLSEAPSASLAIACARRARALQSQPLHALVIGASVFDRTTFPHAAPLAWAAAEAEAVAAMYRNSIRLTDGEATRRRVLAEISAAGIIHFSGHAVTLGARAEQSQLLLAPDGEERSLDALTLSTVTVPRAQLVYLSACRSGGGTGALDGVDNLALAFVVGGAPAVIAAKWDVEDAVAPAAAKKFHRLLAAGEDPVVAARKAFQSVRTPAGMIVIGGSALLLNEEEDS